MDVPGRRVLEEDGDSQTLAVPVAGELDLEALGALGAGPSGKREGLDQGADDVVVAQGAAAVLAAGDRRLEAVLEDRHHHRPLSSPQTINLELSAIDGEQVSAERARVSFDQAYRSDRYNDDVRKTLELVREDGRWKIVEERVE